MTNIYNYAGKPSEVRNSAGVPGVLIRSLGEFFFRVCDEDGEFIDYEIRHDDLSVTIDPDELAAFYQSSDRQILDHSPSVLGLDEVE